jgi:hypothetical protein
MTASFQILPNLETLHHPTLHKEAGAEMLLNNPRFNQLIM